MRIVSRYGYLRLIWGRWAWEEDWHEYSLLNITIQNISRIFFYINIFLLYKRFSAPKNVTEFAVLDLSYYYYHTPPLHLPLLFHWPMLGEDMAILLKTTAAIPVRAATLESPNLLLLESNTCTPSCSSLQQDYNVLYNLSNSNGSLNTLF